MLERIFKSVTEKLKCKYCYLFRVNLKIYQIWSQCKLGTVSFSFDNLIPNLK